MNKKEEKAQEINVIIWVVLTIVCIVICYCKWREFGDYTLIQFFASLVFYGGFNTLMCYLCWEVIHKIFNK